MPLDPIRAHTHFCGACYSHRGPKNAKGPRGWWRCTEKPCIRPELCACDHHVQRHKEYERRIAR